MISFAPGILLAQVRPSSIGSHVVVPQVTILTEVTLILAASADETEIATFTLHHDVGGETYDQSNHIIKGTIATTDLPKDSRVFQAQYPGTGIMLGVGDSLGITVSTADVVTVSVYGVTRTVAQSMYSRG